MSTRVGLVFTIDHELRGQDRDCEWHKKLQDLQEGDLLAIDTRPEGLFDYVYVVFQGFLDNEMVVDSCFFAGATGLLVALEYVTRVAVIDYKTIENARSQMVPVGSDLF